MRLQTILEKDEAASARLRLRQTKGIKYTLFAFLAHSGDSWFWLMGLGLIWLFASRGWRTETAIMASGIVILAALVMAIKLSVRRRRPDGDWGAIYRHTDPHSFPSGHAARAILLAVIACGFGPVWVAVALFAWTPLVSLARVLMGVHYLSDILAGWVLGILTGATILIFQTTLVNLAPFIFR